MERAKVVVEEMKVMVDGKLATPGPMVLGPGAACIYPGCARPATGLAAAHGEDREAGDVGSPLGPYCEEHAGKVAGEGRPEYVEHCPNCGCKFGTGS